MEYIGWIEGFPIRGPWGPGCGCSGTTEQDLTVGLGLVLVGFGFGLGLGLGFGFGFGFGFGLGLELGLEGVRVAPQQAQQAAHRRCYGGRRALVLPRPGYSPPGIELAGGSGHAEGGGRVSGGGKGGGRVSGGGRSPLVEIAC